MLSPRAGRFARRLPARTAPGDIVRQLGMRKPDGLEGSCFRSNLRITDERKGECDGRPKRDVRRDLLGLIARHRGESAIVYYLSRGSVESTADHLRSRGVNAAPDHAGLADTALREDTQRRTVESFRLLGVPDMEPAELARYGAAFLGERAKRG